MPQYTGGLAPIANGLLHQHPQIRDDALVTLSVIDQYPIGHLAVSQMNYYHRSLFFRQAEKRSHAMTDQQHDDQSHMVDTTPQQVPRVR
jgi:hypothetical protein